MPFQATCGRGERRNHRRPTAWRTFDDERSRPRGAKRKNSGIFEAVHGHLEFWGLGGDMQWVDCVSQRGRHPRRQHAHFRFGLRNH